MQADRTFLKPYLRGARGVLEWFEARLAPSGLLGKLEWWNFADWVDSFEDGVPPTIDGGESAILSLQFALALREAADLESAFGSAAQAATYRATADKVVAAVVKACWDNATKGLLADTPAKKTFSQHVNLLGVLADAVPAAGRRALMTKVLDDASLTQTTYYFKFYLFRALQKAEMGDRYLDLLGAVARDARSRADDVGGDARSHALRFARLERAPFGRSPHHRRRHPAGRARLRARAHPPAPRHFELGEGDRADAER